MPRLARNLLVVALCVLFLAAGGPDGDVSSCTIANANYALTGNQEFGLFFAYIFNIPGKTGALGAQLVKLFEGEQVFAGGKSKTSTKAGARTYKGALQQGLGRELVVPTKPKKDKRLTITAIHDFGSGRFQLPREGTGVFDARVSVAVDGTKGLASEQTSVRLQMNRPLEPFGLDATRVVATYMEDGKGLFSGWEVQAFDQDNTPLDDAQTVAGTAELDLRLQQTDTQLLTMARPTPPGGPSADEIGTDWLTISAQAVAVPPQPFTLECGAFTLFKKGTVYFDFFAIGEVIPGPALESALFGELLGAVTHLGEARDALTQEAADLEQVEAGLIDAVETLGDVQSDLGEALDGDDLDDTTEGKTAAKVLKRAIKGAERLLKKVQAGKAKKPDKLVKPTQKVIDDTLVTMANLSGLKTRSGRQLNFVPPGG